MFHTQVTIFLKLKPKVDMWEMSTLPILNKPVLGIQFVANVARMKSVTQ